MYCYLRNAQCQVWPVILIRCGAGRDAQVVAVFGTCRRLGNLRYDALREALLSFLK